MRTRLPFLLLTLPAALAACATPDSPVGPTAGVSLAAAISADPATVAVGRAIFFDQRLSVNGNQSCASCHAPAWGWTGPSPSINAAGAVYEGSIPGAFGDRKPPTSAYATPSPVFHEEGGLFEGGNFWDGRATGWRLGNPAAEQALGPFLNPKEQALAAPGDVVRLICEGPYGAQFRAVFGEAACDPANVASAYDDVGMAVASFEASPESNAFSSKFDYFLRGQVKLTTEERQGMALFKGKGKCVQCHVLDEQGRGHGGISAGRVVLTDYTFDNLGVPRNPENPMGPAHTDRGLGGFLETTTQYAALAPENLGKQKVPTLRNVDLRPSPTSVKAYTHNGYFKSLEGLVHFYNTRDVKPTCPGAYTAAQAMAADCWPAPEWPATVNRDELGNLRLSPAQERAIVAFLRTLSDGYLP